MSNTADGAEAALCAAYQKEAECYARALALCDDLSGTLRQGESIDIKLEQVLSVLNEVAETERGVAGHKRVWEESGRQPGAQLLAVLARVSELIERLAARIREVEKEAAQQRSGLIPELDAVIRSQQMQRAYGSAPQPPRSFGQET
jgi:hypothetical protein